MRHLNFIQIFILVFNFIKFQSYKLVNFLRSALSIVYNARFDSKSQSVNRSIFCWLKAINKLDSGAETTETATLSEGSDKESFSCRRTDKWFCFHLLSKMDLKNIGKKVNCVHSILFFLDFCFRSIAFNFIGLEWILSPIAMRLLLLLLIQIKEEYIFGKLP